jgi:hypothetical protein
MSEQQINTCLSLLKIDLGITTSAYDERLIATVKAAAQAITKEGASTLDADNGLDAQLITMYASWLWNKRRSGEGMPRMLRYALNNRIFGEKMGGGQ